MKRISKAIQVYADKTIGIGESFDVEPEHISLLLVLDRIEPQQGDEYPNYSFAATHPQAQPQLQSIPKRELPPEPFHANPFSYENRSMDSPAPSSTTAPSGRKVLHRKNSE